MIVKRVVQWRLQVKKIFLFFLIIKLLFFNKGASKSKLHTAGVRTSNDSQESGAIEDTSKNIFFVFIKL